MHMDAILAKMSYDAVHKYTPNWNAAAMVDNEPRLVDLQEAAPYMKACFPEVDMATLPFGENHIAMTLNNAAFSIIWLGHRGTLISYIGTLPEYRGAGYATKLVRPMKDLSPLYAECDPQGAMHRLLLKEGWGVHPIPYVCPACGSVPRTASLQLLGDTPKVDCVPFIRSSMRRATMSMKSAC